jgi:two-component SAPR family response regulator
MTEKSGHSAGYSFIFAVMAALKIMLLEDDPIIALNIQTVLLQAGHEVWLVSSEEAALDTCAAEHPDLAILNIHFRQPARRLALAQQLSSGFMLRVGLITDAYIGETVSDRIPILYKPFTQQQLREFILSAHSHTRL